jgi:hypothetical protein
MLDHAAAPRCAAAGSLPLKCTHAHTHRRGREPLGDGVFGHTVSPADEESAAEAAALTELASLARCGCGGSVRPSLRVAAGAWWLQAARRELQLQLVEVEVVG